MDGTLPVEKGPEVVDHGPDRFKVRPVRDTVEGGRQSVHEVAGRLLGGHPLGPHFGEVLVVNLHGMNVACVAGAVGHDNPSRVGTHRSVLITAPGGWEDRVT